MNAIKDAIKAGRTDRPWATCSRGKSIDPNQLAEMLRPYAVEPDRVRVGPDHKQVRGYRRDWFDDPFKRYL